MKKFLIMVTFVLCCIQAQADNLYVASEQHSTIQSAINDANNGDTIIVSTGTYRENIGFRGKAITVRSTDPNDPNVVSATIIDGSEPNDPNYGSTVTFKNGEDANSVLSGFTITGGTGSWLPVSWEFKALRWNRCGGGVVCCNMSAPTISKNVFTNNTAGQGGGIYIYGDPVDPNDPSNPSVHLTPVIAGNTFINNSAIVEHGFAPPDTNYPNNDHGDGGAIAGFQGCDPIITDNVILNNHADWYGGAIHLRQWCNGLIENNHIIDNNSGLGAGIHITYTSSPTVKDNLIKANTAKAFGGGGIYVMFQSNPLITNNVIMHNSSLSSRGGGIGVFGGSNPTIKFNTVAKNSSLLGGGVHLDSGNAVLYYNTIADNSAARGAGVCLAQQTRPTIVGNIIAANTDSEGIYGEANSVATFSYNNVWGNAGGNYGGVLDNLTGLSGNISKNPRFVSTDTNDFSLTAYSPCINAGDPNFVAGPNDVDINGDPRLIGQYVDIGADEAWPVWNTTNQTQYLAIQQAIDDANDGDTIIVGQGRYYETISFGTHQIILSSADPNDWDVAKRTIIDANQSGTAVVIAGGQNASTVLTGFTITNGDATNGHAGGIWCYASPRIERNIITNNYAYYKGGGMYFWSSSARPLVINNIIVDNVAAHAGGVFCDAASEVTLINNYIAGNSATFGAGGIACGVNCGRTLIMNNQVIANTAPRGAGLFSEQTTDRIQIIGNLFCGNYATIQGGAIEIGYGDPNIVNNSLVANRCPVGAGIYLESGSSPNIVNNIIAFGSQGHGIYCLPDANSPGEPNLAYNDVYNNNGNYGGSLPDQTGLNGNISTDPNFVNTGYWDDANTPGDANDDFFAPGNYHILPISACINAGDNNSLPVLLQTDIDGEERIFGTAVDIGADEVVTNPADLNLDGAVDFLDITTLTNEWLTGGSHLQSDLSNNGFIDFADYAELAGQWLWIGGWHR